MILAPENCSCPAQDAGASIDNSPACNGTLLFMALLNGFIHGRCAIADPCRRVVGAESAADEYDFIVVGAGAAGSIVAGRLSEVKDYKVLILEAGGPDPLPSRVPSMYRSYWGNLEADWMYRTQTENYCLDQNGLGCVYHRGKTLGGSSVLNGMMYHRGHAADYEDWRAFGAEGWSWEDNLPYFDMTEGNKQIGSVADAQYHGDSGPLPVQQFRHQPDMIYDILYGINETGIPLIADMNNPNTPEGFAIAQAFNDDGQRYTTARAYLKPESERPNLKVLTNAHVTKVLIENNTAYGVEYIHNGETKTVRAFKEVILSGGALNSPQILMLSGIGPRETLTSLNIPVVADLPVGRNLRNHLGITLQFLLEKQENVQSLDWSVAAEYLLERTGPMTSTGLTQVSGLLYSSLANQSRSQPDLQFFINGLYAECSASGVVGEQVGCTQSAMNISMNGVALLPRSVGYLTLNSSDPLDPPVFYPRYFSHPADMVMVKDAGRKIKQIVEAESLQKKFGIKLDPEYIDVCNATPVWSDPWLECMARVHTDPQNHQIGTAAISRVVDNDLKVFNVTGLRVIDAASMPTQPTGNPQGAIMMVAERGAHMIKQEWSSSNGSADS